MFPRQHGTPVEGFKQLVLSNPNMQVMLAKATDRDDFIRLAVDFGQEMGLRFTAEELDGELSYHQEAKRSDMWLSDELLESVAGIQAKQSDTGTCTCVGCATVSTLGCHTGPKCSC